VTEIRITTEEQIDALSGEDAITLVHHLPSSANYGEKALTETVAKLLLKSYLREQKRVLEELAKDPEDREDPFPDNFDDLYAEMS